MYVVKQNSSVFNINMYQPDLSSRFCLKMKIQNRKLSFPAVLILFKFFSLKKRSEPNEEGKGTSFLFFSKITPGRGGSLTARVFLSFEGKITKN